MGTILCPEAAMQVADMNGPVLVWGTFPTNPAEQPHGVAPAVVASVRAYHTLSHTLHGRTWTGTTALMSAVLAA